MKELGRGTTNNAFNITSLIRTPQECIRHPADGRNLHSGRVYIHTHTHTHIHTSMAVTLHRQQLSQISSNPLCLAYNADGPGYYDGTKELTQEVIIVKIMKSN